MTTLHELVQFLNQTYDVPSFPADPSSNGLQVEASTKVQNIVLGVDACQQLFDMAAEYQADLVIVHHGLFWKGMPYPITGIMAKRIGTLFANQTSLYACHLPMDAHPKYGHNAGLASMLKLKHTLPFFPYAGTPIGVSGVLPKKQTIEKIAHDLSAHLDGAEVRVFGEIDKTVTRIGIVSGGGGTAALEAAAAEGLELLVTGEFEHQSFHPMAELGVSVIALGHYASETVALIQLEALLKQKFPKINTLMIDIPTQL